VRAGRFEDEVEREDSRRRGVKGKSVGSTKGYQKSSGRSKG